MHTEFRWYALTIMAKVSNNQTLQCLLKTNEYTSTLNAIITKWLMSSTESKSETS